jgi:hypothetical protein
MVAEYRAIWTVPGGGTGYSVFHLNDPSDGTQAQLSAVAIRGFFSANIGLFPDDVTIEFDDEMRVLSNTGTLQSVWPIAPPASVTGTQTLNYSRAAGIRVNWLTGAIVGGRRLNGRTFLVPASSGAFDTVGQVNDATVTAVQGTAQDLIDDLDAQAGLVVWSRTHAFTAGVQSASVPKAGAILRGRRD